MIEASATLNAGQSGSLMKSVTTPYAQPVDQVAERPADDQAAREPHQAALAMPREVGEHDGDHDDRDDDHAQPRFPGTG